MGKFNRPILKYGRKNGFGTDKQHRIYTPLTLRASPHLLPQSLQQTLYIRERCGAINLAQT